MKKRMILAAILSLATVSNVYAAETGGIGIQALSEFVTSPGAIVNSEEELDVTLEGEILLGAPTDVITVLMPTQVYFNLQPDLDDWNQVLSPTISISNMGSGDVRVAVTKAVAEGASLTVTQPTGKQVRLGIAHEGQMSEDLLSSTYLLRSNLSDSIYIDLGLIGHDSSNNTAKLKVFGDTANGEWTDGDIFAIKTVFKVSM